MIKIHEKAVRGRTQMGWLDSYHTFSFGGFSDPTRMGFGNLRVINEDTVIPSGGFAMHDHAGMDILTLVTEGQLRHEDDQGNVALIGPGEIQGMSAGTGVRHSEFNASNTDLARFLQIWLIPDHVDNAPSYHQATLPHGKSVVLAGPPSALPLIPLGSRTTLTLHRFDEGEALALPRDDDAKRYVHLMDGLADADGERVSAGDGLQIPAQSTTTLTWATAGTALVFDFPAHRKDILQ